MDLAAALCRSALPAQGRTRSVHPGLRRTDDLQIFLLRSILSGAEKRQCIGEQHKTWALREVRIVFGQDAINCNLLK